MAAFHRANLSSRALIKHVDMNPTSTPLQSLNLQLTCDDAVHKCVALITTSLSTEE